MINNRETMQMCLKAIGKRKKPDSKYLEDFAVHRFFLFIYFFFTWKIQESLNKFPDFFCMGTFIDSTHMKL